MSKLSQAPTLIVLDKAKSESASGSAQLVTIALFSAVGLLVSIIGMLTHFFDPSVAF